MAFLSPASRSTMPGRRAVIAGTVTFGFFLLKGLAWLAAMAMVGAGVGW